MVSGVASALSDWSNGNGTGAMGQGRWGGDDGVGACVSVCDGPHCHKQCRHTCAAHPSIRRFLTLSSMCAMALETHTLQREVCTPTTAAQTAAPYGTTPSAHTHAQIHWSTYHQTTTATATQAPTRRVTKSRVPRVPLPLPFPFPFPGPFSCVCVPCRRAGQSRPRWRRTSCHRRRR